jgi:hypothetical protein
MAVPRPSQGPRLRRRAAEPTPTPVQSAPRSAPKVARGICLPHRRAQQNRYQAKVAGHPILERYNVSPQTIIVLPGDVWEEPAALSPQEQIRHH